MSGIFGRSSRCRFWELAFWKPPSESGHAPPLRRQRQDSLALESCGGPEESSGRPRPRPRLAHHQGAAAPTRPKEEPSFPVVPHALTKRAPLPLGLVASRARAGVLWAALHTAHSFPPAAWTRGGGGGERVAAVATTTPILRDIFTRGCKRASLKHSMTEENRTEEIIPRGSLQKGRETSACRGSSDFTTREGFLSLSLALSLISRILGIPQRSKPGRLQRRRVLWSVRDLEKIWRESVLFWGYEASSISFS